MKINPEEITTILEKELNSVSATIEMKEVGRVLQVGDSIARVYGLQNVMAGEMVKFPNDVSHGQYFSLLCRQFPQGC